MEIITPQWPAPVWIKALTTTRHSGSSLAPYTGNNLSTMVGDVPEHVTANRQRLQRHCPHPMTWLTQQHTTAVVTLPLASSQEIIADGAYTTQPNTPCSVLTADCLPLLCTNRAGTEIAALHAGWRGLADGIIEQGLAHWRSDPKDILVWLGPAISSNHFEVGNDVRDAFIAVDPAASSAFIPHADRYLADLYALARQRLQRLGITAVFGGTSCTYAESALFYSYRRQPVTGRMASIIWIEPH